MRLAAKRDLLGLSSRCDVFRRVEDVWSRKRERGLAGNEASSASKSRSLRDRFLPDAESVEGRGVGVVSDVVRALGEELKWCWSDDERANRLEGVLGIVRAGMRKSGIKRTSFVPKKVNSNGVGDMKRERERVDG